MKKIYIIPQTDVVKIRLEHRLLANSIHISNTVYDGDALSKENQNDWDNIWGDTNE